MRLTLLPYFGEAQTVTLKCCLHSKWDSPCCQIANNFGSVMCTVCFNFVQLAVPPLCSRTPRCCLFPFGLGGGVGWGGGCFAAVARATKQLHWAATCMHHYIYRSQLKCGCDIAWNCQPVIGFFVRAHNVTLQKLPTVYGKEGGGLVLAPA